MMVPEDDGGWEERLSAYADGALSGAELEETEARLREDEGLRRRLRFLRALRGAVRAAAPGRAPADLRAGLLARARAAGSPWRRLAGAFRSPAGGALGLGAAGALAAAAFLAAPRAPRPAALQPGSPMEATAGRPGEGPPEGAAWDAESARAVLARELWTKDEGGGDDDA